MKAIAMVCALVLTVAVGCETKKPAPDKGPEKGVDIQAPGGVSVQTGDKADGGGVEVKAPGTDVDVNTKTEVK